MMSNIFNNNSVKNVWRNIAVAVFAVCFALLGLCVTILPTRAADDRGYVVGEIYQNHTNVQHLYDLITGKTNATYADVVAAAENITNAADMREYNNDNDIKVTFGGREWYAVYLSQTNEDNPRPILTLYLTDNYLAETHFVNYAHTSDATYPYNMYGTSYVRALLNNGGQYSNDGQTLIDYPTSNNYALANVTALSDLIVTPSKVAWQASGQDARKISWWTNDARIGGPFRASNENYETESNDGFRGATDNYSSRNGYKNWIDDNLWLPSASEVEVIWSLSVSQKAHGQDSWLRSAIRDNVSICLFELRPAGNIGQRNSGPDKVSGVRPALHLDLAALNLTADNLDDLTVTYDATDQNIANWESKPEWYSDNWQITYTKDGKDVTDAKKDVGEYTVTVKWANYENTITMTVLPKAVTVDGTTIAPQQAAYAYNQKTEVPLNTDAIKVTGLIDGDTIGISYRGLMDDKNAGKDKTVTVTATLTGNSAKNYVLTEAQFTTKVTINPRTIAISNIKAKDKEYDGTDDAILDFSEITYNPIIFVGDDVTVLVKGKYSQKNVSEESLTVTLDYALGLAGADAGNYKIDEEKNNQLVATASIRPRAITVTIKDQVVKVGDTKDLTFSITSGSLAGNDKADTVFTLGLRDGTERDGLPVGEYQIVGTKVGNPNYEVEFANYGIYRVLSAEDWEALQTKDEPKDNNWWLIIIIVMAVAAFIGALVGIGLVIRSHDKDRDSKPAKPKKEKKEKNKKKAETPTDTKPDTKAKA